MTKLTIMAASLPTAPPREHIEASSIAGFDGLGLRLYRSPAFPNWQSWLDDGPLKRDVKILDECGRSNAVICLGISPFLRVDAPAALNGHNRKLVPIVHLNNGKPEQAVSQLLDALNVNVTLSLEWPAPNGSHYTSLDWAKLAMAGTRQFLHDYYNARPSGAQEQRP